MPTAERDVAVIAADLGLGPGGDGMALGVDAEIHRRLAATFAYGLELDQRIRQCEQRGGAGEKLALKVGAEAVAKHGNREAVGDLAQLQDVALGEELRLVDQDAVELALLQLVGDRTEQIDLLVIAVGGGRQSDA